MKKYAFLIALAGLAAFSCSKEENGADVLNEEIIHFTAVANGTDVKTVVDASENWANWEASDQLKIVEYADGVKNKEGSAAIATLSTDHKTASFAATVSGSFPDGAKASYVAAYPANRLSEGGSGATAFYRMMMPAAQSPVVGSFDPNADILLSAPVKKADDSRVTDGDELTFSFHRLGTAVKLSLSGITKDEKLSKVIIKAPVNIAGYVKVDMTNGGYNNDDSTPYSSESDAVTLTFNEDDWVIGDAGTADVWFRILPCVWASGSKLEVTVETDKAYYYRTEVKGSVITLPEDYKFVDGGRTRFAVGLASAVREEKDPSAGLADGDYVILAKNGTTYYALKAEATGSRLVSENYTGSTTSYDGGDANIIWHIAKSGTGYTIKNGTNYLGCEAAKAASLIAEADYNDAECLLSIDEGEGVYAVTMKNDGTKQLARNQSNAYFAFYANSQYKDIVFVPATVDTRTAVTLDFADDVVNLTTADYDSFIGQDVTIDPSGISAISSNLVWEYINTDGIIDETHSSEYAIQLTGTVGSATVNVSFAGDTEYQGATASYTINVTNASASGWVETALADISAGDVFVIVGDNGATYAMNHTTLNAKGAPTATAVSVIGNKLAAEPSADIQWNLSLETDGYMFFPNGITSKWLNMAADNNGLRVSSTSTNGKYWSLDAASGYLTGTDPASATRYVGIYNSADWRSYTSNGGNIAGQTFKFYMLVDSRADAGMSWSASAATATYATGNSLSFTAPTLTQGNASSVTYSSSDETIATISAAGVVSVNLSGNDIKEGSTTISASFDGDADYKPQTVSYTLDVIDNRTAVATPTFNPVAGEVAADTQVAFNCADSGVTFYYTVDGSAPTSASTSGNSVTISSACTVKVIAAKNGYRNSNVASADYTVAGAYETLPFEETFASSKGTFTIDDISNPDNLSYIWNAASGYMKASSYVSSANHNAESWLVSPLIQIPSLASGESAKLKFEHCINKYFGTVSDEATLWVKAEGGSWTKINISYPAVSGTWSSFEQEIIDLSAYAGEKIQFAFKYVGTSTTAGTWEVKNVSLKKYEPLALSSISVSGQKQIFKVGDSFSFGGTVTAHYNDDSTADVTASASFTGYDMSTAGEQTVTVSYTEGTTKTTTYNITVSDSAGPSTYVSTFTSASWASTGDFDWTSGKAGAGFNNNGIQVTSNASYSGANATSNKTFTGVSQVVVTYNTNKSAGAGTLVLKVGSGSDHTENWAWSTGDGRSANYTCTFNLDPAESGAIKLTANTTTNSIYIVSVTVTATAME